MWGRRIAYLTALTGCLVFYVFYQEWISWIALLTVGLLPWLSLALSLPALLTAKAGFRCPQQVRIGVPVRTALALDTPYPAPPLRCRIRLENVLTGISYVGKPGERIPTEHCGKIVISYDQLFIYDYLGLFRRRLRKGDACVVFVEPKAVPNDIFPQSGTGTVSQWRPKPGGGYSEEHDLRLYRPGDDMRQIHWKMSAKTGQLIYREPIEPVLQGYLLTMTLSGTEEELDTKLGKLLSASTQLLNQQMAHRISCLTGKGVMQFTVTDGQSRDEAIRALLATPKVEEDVLPAKEAVLWQQHIGGDDHEA